MGNSTPPFADHFADGVTSFVAGTGAGDSIGGNVGAANRYGGLETAVAVILLGYLILGLSGNLLTIIALLRCPRVRNVTAAFIISLCVADCLFCVLVLPWEVSRFFAGKWVWGKGVICTVLPLIRYWNVAVSLLSIAMITLNRYIMIAHFGIYKSVYRKGWVGLMIAFCWLFPFCILLPTLFGKWGRFGMIEALETCSIIDEKGQSPKKVLFGLGFCVPALVIIICYSLIFYVIHRSDSRMRDHSARASNNGGVVGSGDSPSSGVTLQPKLPGKADKEARRRRNEWRITKMVMIIFATFLVTYLPITLVKFFDPLARYTALHLLGYVLVYLSCCINPIIYVIMNRQYRQAYRTVLLCKSPLLNTFTSHADNSEVEKGTIKNILKTVNRLSFVSPWRASLNVNGEGVEDPQHLPKTEVPLREPCTIKVTPSSTAVGGRCLGAFTGARELHRPESVDGNAYSNKGLSISERDLGDPSLGRGGRTSVVDDGEAVQDLHPPSPVKVSRIEVGGSSSSSSSSKPSPVYSKDNSGFSHVRSVSSTAEEVSEKGIESEVTPRNLQSKTTTTTNL